MMRVLTIAIPDDVNDELREMAARESRRPRLAVHPPLRAYVCYRGHRTPQQPGDRTQVVRCAAKVAARTECSADARLEPERLPMG